MDPVIFTGRLTLAELQHDRPLEYQRLMDEHRLEQAMTVPQKTWITDVGILFGFAVVLIGFFLLILIVMGQFIY
jgi:hypothetical protein